MSAKPLLKVLLMMPSGGRRCSRQRQHDGLFVHGLVGRRHVGRLPAEEDALNTLEGAVIATEDRHFALEILSEQGGHHAGASIVVHNVYAIDGIVRLRQALLHVALRVGRVPQQSIGLAGDLDRAIVDERANSVVEAFHLIDIEWEVRIAQHHRHLHGAGFGQMVLKVLALGEADILERDGDMVSRRAAIAALREGDDRHVVSRGTREHAAGLARIDADEDDADGTIGQRRIHLRSLLRNLVVGAQYANLHIGRIVLELLGHVRDVELGVALEASAREQDVDGAGEVGERNVE